LRIADGENIKILKVARTLSNILEVAIRNMVRVQINVLAVPLLSREHKGYS
jgi:hypothetical protein